MTPGRLGAVSGTASTATVTTRLAPSSNHQTKCVGAGPYWTSALVTSAPAPRPNKVPLPVAIEATPLLPGCRSISAAAIPSVPSPTATPCNALATNRSPTPPAARNKAHETAVIKRLARMTGRRPR